MLSLSLRNQYVYKFYLNFYLNSFYYSRKIKSLDIKLEFLHEDKLLGTGGAVVNAIHKKTLKGNFLVMNSDTWISSSHRDLIKMDSPSIAIIEVEDTSRFGEVLLDESNKGIPISINR